MSKDDVIRAVEYNQLILTKEFLNQIEKLYAEQQSRITAAMKKIKSGHPFGYENCYGDYFPCDFIGVVDSQEGIIQYRNSVTNKIEEECVLKILFG